MELGVKTKTLMAKGPRQVSGKENDKQKVLHMLRRK